MRKYFEKSLGLSEQGAKDLEKASLWAAGVNLILMGSSSLLFLFLQESLPAVLQGKNPDFQVLIYGVCTAILLIMIYISYYFSYNASYLSAYTESATKRITLAETLRKLPLSFFRKKDLSDITTTIMTDTAELEQSFSHYIPALFGAIASTLVISVGLLCFHWQMALATLWVVPVSLLVCLSTHKFQRSINEKAISQRLDYDQKITECIENCKDIKSNNQKTYHQEVLSQQLEQRERHSILSELGIGLPVSFAQMILKMGMATAMLQGIYLLAENKLDFLHFLVFMVIITRIFDPLVGALINLSAMLHSMVSIDRMIGLENTPIQSGTEGFFPNGYDISFQKVEFAYDNSEKVLNELSFTAKQGEVTALVGPSGGGKSTAMKLAARFWDVTQGKVEIGGVDISTIEPEILLQDISIVFQDVTLFNNSMMENIRIGRKDATDEEVIAASKAAHCHDFVQKLPQGYATFIGENGSTLSGGERQRISIARALLKDAPIVLLDEATSSLDIQSETAVQEAISRLTQGKTCIVIAHRMRTIASADHIILLDQGAVVEQGNHQKLMARGGKYAHMVDLQMKSMAWRLE